MILTKTKLYEKEPILPLLSTGNAHRADKRLFVQKVGIYQCDSLRCLASHRCQFKSLADKAGTKDKETKEALQKLTDALKSDMNAATFQQMEAVLKDPAKSGVDVHAPIYIFNAPSFPYTTMVAKVQNEDDLLKLLEVTEKEQISSHVAEADGYSFVQINKQALLAFTPTTLMVVNYTGTSQLEKSRREFPPY